MEQKQNAPEFLNPFQGKGQGQEQGQNQSPPPADPFALLESVYEVVLPSSGKKAQVKSLTVGEDVFLTRDTFMDVASVFRKFGKVVWDSLTDESKKELGPTETAFYKRLHPGSDLPALLYGLLAASFDELVFPETDCPSCGAKIPPKTVRPADVEITKLNVVPVNWDKAEEFLFERKTPAGVAYVKLTYRLFDSWFDKLQVAHFLSKTEPVYTLIGSPEKLEEKLRFFQFDLPNVYRVFMQLTLALEAGVKDPQTGNVYPQSLRRCQRPLDDWAVSKPSTLRALKTCKTYLSELPAAVTNAFLKELAKKQEEHGVPEIEFAPVTFVCPECGHREDVPFEPALFFLLKALGAL